MKSNRLSFPALAIHSAFLEIRENEDVDGSNRRIFPYLAGPRLSKEVGHEKAGEGGHEDRIGSGNL
jgi:hypothetical protein